MKTQLQQSSSLEATEQHRLRVLMVEDDAGYRVFVRQLLVQHPKARFEFIGVGSFAQCRQYLSTEFADVILMDLSLPDCCGLKTVAKIMEISSGTPIIILTASDDDSNNAGLLALGLGVQDYLVKHLVSNDGLVRCIRYAIERKKFEESANRLSVMRDFVSTLAHDLRVPLLGAGNVLNSALANKFGALSQEQEQAMIVLQRNNNDQLALVQKLLDLYKYEIDSPNLTLETIDLRSLIYRCVESFSLDARQRILLRIASDLPMVLGERDALSRLFSNLLDNAFKYGDPQKGIEIKSDFAGSRLSIHVHNFGPAISAEMQSGLFDRLWQGIPGKSYVAHTGIGLYHCQRIASLHRGRLSCASSPELGTTMTIAMPAYFGAS